jgi:solute carrier family 29 (equilibrative nucleoside transporter), member 1/2/3
MLGISSLIGWNAVCNSFPFYDSKYDDLDHNQTSDFYFPIPLMFANFMWGPFMPYFSSKFSLFSRISFGLIVLSVVMLLLPLIAQLMPHSGVGFALCLICTYLIGSFNSIA